MNRPLIIKPSASAAFGPRLPLPALPSFPFGKRRSICLTTFVPSACAKSGGSLPSQKSKKGSAPRSIRPSITPLSACPLVALSPPPGCLDDGLCPPCFPRFPPGSSLKKRKPLYPANLCSFDSAASLKNQKREGLPDFGPWTLGLWTLDLGPWTLDLGPDRCITPRSGHPPACRLQSPPPAATG